ncbi:MAG TPA: hypothetical protein PLJ75_08655, partial [Spirochaetota bacterium]|nr:hypothetical protein [Spirochaetota bacterium]
MNNSTTNPIYSFIQSIPFLTNIIKKGGIRLKWVTAVSALMVIVISIISFLLITISEHALIKANDKLCQTIA